MSALTMLELRTAAALTGAVACFLSGCAVEAESGPAVSGFGELHLALTGNLQGAASFRLRVYQGAVTSPAQVPLQDFGCKAYGGAESNKLIIQDLEARGDYAVLLELFEDAGCSKQRYRAYRGGIAVTAGTGATVKDNPYWLPTVEFGKLSPLAQVKPWLKDTAASKTCSIDADCQGIHVNATCDSNKNKCRVENLFPLNGWSRRGLPSSVSLDDGRVAIIGGLSVLTNNFWAASAEQVEIFDARTATFAARLVKNAGPAVAMADAVTLSNGAFALVGGTSSAKVLLSPGKLTAQLDTASCAAAGGECPVSDSLARWTVTTTGDSAAQQFALGLPVAFPATARVMTPAGERLLVAGGTEVPVTAGFDKRRGKAMLCKADAAEVTCAESSPAMKAGRANAAVACVGLDASGGCTKVALVGGRKSPTSPLTEIYDASANTFGVANDVGAPPQDLHGGRLLKVAANKYLLVGATAKKLFLEDTELATSGALPPYLITVDAAATPPVLSWAVLDLGPGAGADGGRRLMPAIVQLADNSVLLVGGLDAALQPIQSAQWISPEGTLRSLTPANFARFGATASRVTGKGPLAGCAVIAGGFSLGADSALEPQNQVELFCPYP